MLDIYLKKNQLRRKSIYLNGLSKDDTKYSIEIKKKQDEIYKEYKFYDNLIKAMEGLKNEET